jgi:NAD(P)H dehydrogenase (quinone)
VLIFLKFFDLSVLSFMKKSLVLIGLTALLSFSLWAQKVPSVLIAYYSPSGSTKILAESIAEGAKTVAGVQVRVVPIDEVSPADLLEAGAIVVGSPVYNGNVAPAVQEFINSWPFADRPLKNKLGAAFATGGGISIGEEQVMLGILHSMLIHGMLVLGGEEAEAAFGASAITGEAPFGSGKVEEQFLVKGRGLGKRVATLLAAQKQ